jgi:hypothetical protein
MIRTILSSIVALPALLLVQPAAEAPTPFERAVDGTLRRVQTQLEGSLQLWADHSSWEDAWEVKGVNYEVRTVASWAFGRDLALSLEPMLAHFQSFTGSDYLPDEPFEVMVFPDIGAYNTFGGGFAEHSSVYGSFYPSGHPDQPVATYYSPNPTRMRMWATHSAVHQFVDRAFNGRPISVSMSEGLACYFTLFWDYSYGVRELKRLKDEGQLIPLRQLLSEPLAAYLADPHPRLIELGMLFTYLLAVREDTRTVVEGEQVVQSPFNDYVRGALRGQNITGHPAHALLGENLDELERDFFAYEGW